MKIRSISALMLLLSVAFTSCLKEEDPTGILKDDNGSTVVEIEEVSYNNFYGSTTDFAFGDAPATETVNLFTLKYHAGRQQPANDIRVKVTASGNGIPAGTVALPAANYSIPAEITIPRGVDRTVAFPFTIKKTGLDLSNVYALTFTISEVSDGAVISELGKEITVTFVIKNKYDGKYNMVGTLVDVTPATDITAKSPAKVELVTTGANSVYLHNSGSSNVASFGDLFPIISAGTESAYGSFTPEFIFDANNNVVAVVNAYGQPASNTRSAAIDPTGVNKYDPATKTLKVKWFMYQPSAVAVGPRTTFDFTFTYTGVR